MLIRFPLAFVLSFLSLLLLPLFFPAWRLFFFAPALIIALYRGSTVAALWKALLCGFIVDLFSSSTFFGVSYLNYALTLALLSRHKYNFFEDNLSTLPLMTFAFSFLSTISGRILSLFFGTWGELSFGSLFTDFLVMPLFDSLFAFLLFSLPFQLSKKFRTIRSQRGRVE